MSEPKTAAYARRMPDPEIGLSKAEIAVRRELMRSPQPVTDAAKEIARLRMELKEAREDARIFREALSEADEWSPALRAALAAKEPT